MMESNETPKRKTAKRIAAILGVIIVVLFISAAWYVNDYYHADSTALAAIDNADEDGIAIREIEGGSLAFLPSDPVAGLIFYPGAKVQPEAYAPLLIECAEQDIACILVRPLFNLAILDTDAAEIAKSQFPEIGTWLLAGHSMGGVAASDYLSRHQSEIAGMAFLASYTSADLSNYGEPIVSLIGTNDMVINRDAYEAAQSKLPLSAKEVVIEGGNHAFYGNYGNQSGDGSASISRDEQQEITVEAIAKLI